MKVSLVLSSYQRARLLDIGLNAIARYKVLFPLEIIVINDGLNDATESVCVKYKDVFDIKYIFTGYRNVDAAKRRSPVFANNIGVKTATGDIVVLSNPEIYHLNECLNIVIPPLMDNHKFLTIPEFMYFDDVGEFTDTEHHNDVSLLSVGLTGEEAVQMPFFMGMWKKEFMNVGGYDEDMTGYASDDNDLMDRLILNGCRYLRTPAKIVHLYHGPRCDSHEHFENPEWVYNYKVRKAGRGKIIRNVGKRWGIL